MNACLRLFLMVVSQAQPALTPGWAGIQVGDIEGCVRVIGAAHAGPYERAGGVLNACVSELNGEPIRSATQFAALISKERVGSRVRIGFADKRSIDVLMTSRPADAESRVCEGTSPWQVLVYLTSEATGSEKAVVMKQPATLGKLLEKFPSKGMPMVVKTECRDTGPGTQYENPPKTLELTYGSSVVVIPLLADGGVGPMDTAHFEVERTSETGSMGSTPWKAPNGEVRLPDGGLPER